MFWEQVAGQGIPMLVKRWDGTTHVDMGGNVRFLLEDTKEEIVEALTEIMDDNHYKKMLNTARKSSVKFMYSDIAKRSIEQK